VLTGSNAIGGMERVALTIARGLGERGWDTRAVFSEGGSGELLDWARGQGVAAEAHRAVRTIDEPRSLQDMRELRQLVHGWSPGVINVHYPGGHISLKDVLALRAAMRGRLIVNVHLPVPWSDSGERKRRMTRIAAMMCDTIVAHSRAMANNAREAGVPERKIALIYNGAPPPASAPDRIAARRRFGLADGDLVVGTMARLAPIKSIDALIEAMAQLPTCATLLIAGDGPERERLSALAHDRLGERVRFTGAITCGQADVYAATDIFVLPSRLEGFPMVLLEAAQNNTAIVATDVGGVAEVIEDGRSGLVVPAGDTAALASAIGCLMQDPQRRAALAEAARQRVAEHFSESQMIEKYRALFEG
jgi:2-deoxystreptamine N-acetyl-D-glucosaminyltransferase/2-deoxystreptamine glucosyltransferase